MATALGTISGLNAQPYLRDQVNVPEAQVDFGINPYDMTFGGAKDVYQFVVHVFSNRTMTTDSQILLDALRDPQSATSIKNVLEADAGLLALVDYCQVQSVSPPATVEVGKVEYLLVTFTIEVVI